jgi:hypothetical protein
MDWRKASYSAENGNCVEVAYNGAILVRDTQDRDGVTLSLPAAAWRAFAAQLRAAVPVS